LKTILCWQIIFSQELDYLKFKSDTAGTYVAIAIEIKVFKINTYEPIIYNRPYKFPLFQGKGSFTWVVLFTAYLRIQELADFVPNFKSNYSKHNIDLQRSVLL
jgi:hypothetical protein